MHPSKTLISCSSHYLQESATSLATVKITLLTTVNVTSFPTPVTVKSLTTVKSQIVRCLWSQSQDWRKQSFLSRLIAPTTTACTDPCATAPSGRACWSSVICRRESVRKINVLPLQTGSVLSWKVTFCFPGIDFPNWAQLPRQTKVTIRWSRGKPQVNASWTYDPKWKSHLVLRTYFRFNGILLSFTAPVQLIQLLIDSFTFVVFDESARLRGRGGGCWCCFQWRWWGTCAPFFSTWKLHLVEPSLYNDWSE